MSCNFMVSILFLYPCMSLKWNVYNSAWLPVRTFIGILQEKFLQSLQEKSFCISWPSAMLRRVNLFKHIYKGKRFSDVGKLATYLSGRSQVEAMWIYFALSILPWAVRAWTVDRTLLYSCSCACKLWDKCKSLHILPELKILGKNASISE